MASESITARRRRSPPIRRIAVRSSARVGPARPRRGAMPHPARLLARPSRREARSPRVRATPYTHPDSDRGEIAHALARIGKSLKKSRILSPRSGGGNRPSGADFSCEIPGQYNHILPGPCSIAAILYKPMPAMAICPRGTRKRQNCEAQDPARPAAPLCWGASRPPRARGRPGPARPRPHRPSSWSGPSPGQQKIWGSSEASKILAPCLPPRLALDRPPASRPAVPSRGAAFVACALGTAALRPRSRVSARPPPWTGRPGGGGATSQGPTSECDAAGTAGQAQQPRRRL